MPAFWLAENMPGTSAWDMFRILFVLILIVVLIIVVLRFIGKRNRGWWMNRSLRSLGGLAVGTNKSMQIVEWNGRIYVLGVGENVTLLDAITDPDAVAALLAEHDMANAASDTPLPAWMRRFGSRVQQPPRTGAATTEPQQTSFEQTLENRLRELSERRQKVEQLLDNRSGDRTDEP